MKKLFITISIIILISLASFTLFILLENWDICKENTECIHQNTSERENDNITVGDKIYFLSSIYKDKRNAKYGVNQIRNELFVSNVNTGEIQQLTFDKSHISAIAYSPQAKSIIFSQAQWSDPTFGYIPVINGPGKFGSFKLFSLDLAQDGLKISPLAQEAMPEIHILGFDKTSKKLLFQTLYRTEYFQVLYIETNNLEKIIPESELFWRNLKAPITFSMQKIDSGKSDVYFKVRDGYISQEDSSFVYNTYKMNLDTRVVKKLTYTPTYRIARSFESLKNASILAPETNKEVNLIDGKGSYEIVPGSVSRGEVTVLNQYTLWEYGPTMDLSTILSVTSGGSGTFYYLVLFDVSGDQLTKKSEVLLGDRIKVTDIGIGEMAHADAQYHVGVGTLERKESNSMADDPTIEKVRIFYVTDQILEEMKSDTFTDK